MRFPTYPLLIVTILVFLMVLPGARVYAADIRAADETFNLIDAEQKGTFTIGEASGILSGTRNRAMQFEYTVSPGTYAGVWISGFGTSLHENTPDVARIRLLSAGAADPDLDVAFELKGTHGMQRIPLQVHDGWSETEHQLDWDAIGTLKEGVVLVVRSGDGPPVSGTLSFSVELSRLPLLRRFSLMPFARLCAILLLGLVVAGLAAVPGRCPGIARQSGCRPARDFRRSGLAADFVLGSSVVFVIVIALGIYDLSGRTDAGWSCVVLGLAAVAVSEWMKYGLSGKHLAPFEAFRDMSATGLLTVSSSSLPVLQAPGDWSQVLLLSSIVAAAAALVYHLFNLYCLATSGRHSGTVAGVMIVGTPYLFGSLLLLQPSGLSAAWPAALKAAMGLLLVWGFNEAIANTVSAARQRKMIHETNAHLVLLAGAGAVVAAPWIADIGSGSFASSLSPVSQVSVMTAAAALSQAALWAEIYLITGILLSALGRKDPSSGMAQHTLTGMKKGMVFGGVFIGLISGIGLLSRAPFFYESVATYPLVTAMLVGAMAFPFAKTVIETFDGTQGFFRRLVRGVLDPWFYLRGAVVGSGLGFALGHATAVQSTPHRVAFGILVGFAASTGITLLRDLLHALRRRGGIQTWRLYLVHALFGIVIGAGFGFYFDSAQVSVVVSKFQQYLGSGLAPQPYGSHLLLSKWGYVHLGAVTGGVKLLFSESLMGVLSWAIPAWLFAINGTFMSAFFRKDRAPVSGLFTGLGLLQLGQSTIQVFRWGLWMAPIIFTFLRPMADPTWYNQDGAVRTLIAAFNYFTLSPDAFHDWSLGVFISILAYNSIRVLIWLDHMGLRVATLVNLSFLGMDRLDRKLARFLGPAAATAQCIPEGVRRFATWAPLLIPFYLPRGKDWDFVWSRAEELQIAGAGTGLSVSPGKGLLIICIAVAVCTFLFAIVRRRKPLEWRLSNSCYETVLKPNGEMFSSVTDKGYDVSRRSYDVLDPAGRALFLVDSSCREDDEAQTWPVLGHFPRRTCVSPVIEHHDGRLRLTSCGNGIRTTVDISIAGDDPAELWTILVENLTARERQLRLVPYLEWVLNRPESDRGHTQYNRLYPEMEYVAGLHSVLAWHKQSKAMGILAADVVPEGFLTSRIDFIGRAQSLASPRILQTLAFSEARDTGFHPTFDPIGSLVLGVNLKPGEAGQVKLLIGLTSSRRSAAGLISRHLGIPPEDAAPSRPSANCPPVRHGEILPGTPQPYHEYSGDGTRLLVRTPLTPRPYDHTMSNALGHVMVVTNRGLHTSSSGNSQQNRLTPDCPDIVTREVPGETIYLYDPEDMQWYSPTYHPLNDPAAQYEVEFGVDGIATYRMKRGSLATELTAFVPPDDPAGVYLLTIRNLGAVERNLRVAPYFQIVLSDQPENAGPLKVRYEVEDQVLYFENPRNGFRTGPAFAAMSAAAELVETCRGRFFGPDTDVAHPFMINEGAPYRGKGTDNRPVAALLTTVQIPPESSCTISIVLGQADNMKQAAATARKYRDPGQAYAALSATRKWWAQFIGKLKIESGHVETDRYADWLKYQTLAERIWARRGFYQASGAYGFRDQLQDCVNLVWVDPLIARSQIVLHASQQFIEGDVVHWFHRLQDGRTGFAARTYASDNLLWLAWAAVEYVEMTGDTSILDEGAPYLAAEQPLAPLPAGKHGMGFIPLRSSRTDSVYRHCVRAVNLVLKRRMGAHGLPLIGAGDWNDGLDEIGSRGKGESVWLGFFLYYILKRLIPLMEGREDAATIRYYVHKEVQLECALQCTWRRDRYLRAIHDDGTEIGVLGSGVWEIDALTAAWAVMSGIDPWRGRKMFDTAIATLEKGNTILLGWPPLREDTMPYLGRSSRYPEGVRENGMYCHGVQWLVGAARILSRQCQDKGDVEGARKYAAASFRLWHKISPLPHVEPDEIEVYGGQPNKQAADIVTAHVPGRMGWHGYTGAAGWMFRQLLEGVYGLRLESNRMIASSRDEAPFALAPAGVVWNRKTVREDPAAESLLRSQGLP